MNVFFRVQEAMPQTVGGMQCAPGGAHSKSYCLRFRDRITYTVVSRLFSLLLLQATQITAPFSGK
jgi:hypothetical protein